MLHRRRDRWIVNATTVGLAVVGLTSIGYAAAAQQHAPAPAASVAGRISPDPGSAGVPDAAPPVVAASVPTAIDIPAIRVHSRLSRLGKTPDGAVAVPKSFQQAGWYDGSVTPGQPGSTVILGHVDSYLGPGVFFRLGALHPGDLVDVHRADGTTVVFTVTGVRSYPKDHFPTAAVYGGTDVPTIRLVTCGGSFDHATGHYRSNVVAFGQLTRVKQSAATTSHPTAT